MAKKKGPLYGSSTSRPVGDGGRGKHTGKAGPLGGKHRDPEGCRAFALILLVGVTGVTGSLIYGAVQVVQAVI